VIEPSPDYEIGFFDKGDSRGIRMTSKGKTEWQSFWIKEDELMNEIKSWEGFELVKIEKGEIAFNVLLRKR